MIKVLDVFQGIILSLILCNQSIRAMFHYNFIWFFFASLLIVIILRFMHRKQSGAYSSNELVIFGLYFLVCLYALLTAFIGEKGSEGLLLELIVLGLFLHIGREASFRVVRSFFGAFFLITLIQVCFLLVNRDHFYTSGVNYLLISVPIGLLACLCVAALLWERSKARIVIYLVVYFLAIASLLTMQSRAVFIFTLMFTFLLPVVFFKSIKIGFYLLSLIMIVSFLFYESLQELYFQSVISVRLNDLLDNFESEPRWQIYSIYFASFYDFFLTGFGLGGTPMSLYANTSEKYPHNFILEFISEFGIIGGVFSFWLIISTVLYATRKLRFNKYETYIFVASCYFILNFMKSFSIYDSSMLFLFAGLAMNRKLSSV